MTTYAHIDTLATPVYAFQHTVPAGQAVVIAPPCASWTLSVVPGSGGTVLAEVSCSPRTTTPDAMTWHALDEAASAAMVYSFLSPVTAIRVTAATADAVAELAA